MKLLLKEQMEKLTTRRLLAYKNSLLRCNETQSWDIGPTINGIQLFPKIKKLTKDMIEWQQTYSIVKEILASREHIEK